MAHRADLNQLSGAERQTLVKLMMGYLDDAIVATHLNLDHNGVRLFTAHADFIAGMEAHLTANGGGPVCPVTEVGHGNPHPK